MTVQDDTKQDAGTASTDSPKTEKSKGKTDKKATAKKADASKSKDKTAKKADKPNGKDKKVAAKTDKKPATKVVVEKDVFGFRKGSKKSQAAAMYNSKKGATLAEVKEKTGSSQLNLLTELEGRVTINTTKEKGTGKKQVTRYKIVIPEGGVKAAKPVKKEDKVKPAAKADKKADKTGGKDKKAATDKKADKKADKKVAAKPAKKAKAEAQASA